MSGPSYSDAAWNVVDALYGEDRATAARLNSIETFLERLPPESVVEAAQIARKRLPHVRQARFRYFCTVCWNRIREAQP